MPQGISMELWLTFLAAHNIVYVRTEASHDVFDHAEVPLRRCLTVRSQKDVEIPLTHMMTNLRAMGKQMSFFTKWQKANIGKGGKVKKPKKTPDTSSTDKP